MSPESTIRGEILKLNLDGTTFRVRSPRAAELRVLLAAPDVTISDADEDGLLEVNGLSPAEIGDAASEHAIPIHELTPLQASLEEAFMTLTRDEIEFKPLVDAEKDEVAA